MRPRQTFTAVELDILRQLFAPIHAGHLRAAHRCAAILAKCPPAARDQLAMAGINWLSTVAQDRQPAHPIEEAT